MTLRSGLFFIALALPVTAVAKNEVPPEIRAVESQSTDVFAVLQGLAEADAALRARNYVAAQRGYESVLLHDPGLGPARRGLRRTLIAVGELKRAATLIDDPESADAVLIRVLSQQSQDPVSDLRAALQYHQDARLWNALGRVQDSQGDPMAARQAYAMAGLLGQRPGLADNNIGQSHWMAGEFDSALDAFLKAVAADPLDKRFDNNRRRALVMTGDIQTAIDRLTAEDASVFLAQAGDLARLNGEDRLAELLYETSLNLSLRHDPHVAEKLSRLKK